MSLNNFPTESKLDLFQAKFRESPQFLKILVILGLLLILPLATFVSQQAVKLRSSAVSAVSLSLFPQTATLPPNTTFSLSLNAGTNSISFVHLELTFDKNKVRLANTITINTTKFQRIVKQSTMDEANQSGTIVLALAVDPSPATGGPTGTFELATLTFTAISVAPNDSTNLSFVDANIQIVDVNANPLSLEIPTPVVQLTLNPVSAPTPLPSLSPSPQPSPAPTSPPVGLTRVNFGSSSSQAGENKSDVKIPVKLSATSSQTVTVDYAAAGGTAASGVDYQLVSGTLSFPPGTTTQNINVTILDDKINENDETIILSLTNPTNATLGSPSLHTRTIKDNDGGKP
jgi:hypothetical protein